MHLYEIATPIGQHDDLNPLLWDGENLKEEVRLGLIKIARDFLDYVDVPVDVVDVVIAGGNANFTYTEKSDIDLHIIADLSKTECDREAAELFDTKRLLYKKEHDIKIKGIPVELYIEDVATPAVSAAYSLIKKDWVRKPVKRSQPWDQKEVERMIKVWKTVLSHAIQTGDLQTTRNALKLLREYRKLGLKTKDGEYSVPNLVYKSLRNDQTLEALVTLVNKLHDKDLTVNNQ